MNCKLIYTATYGNSGPAVVKLDGGQEKMNTGHEAFHDEAIMLPEVGEDLTDKSVLEHSRNIAPAEVVVDVGGYISDLSESESAASDDSGEPDLRRLKDEPPTYIVSHPWAIVDYHLYICSVESGKDVDTRRNGMLVYDGVDCRPIQYSELLQDNAFSPYNIDEDKQYLFWGLPIADLGPSFNGRHYILGFDCKKWTLFARHFDWVPSKTDDLWCVWDLGFDMYTVTIRDLVTLLASGLSEDVNIGLGLLSSSPFCMALGTSDDPGMEIVITILFCQWVLDFVEVLFKDDEKTGVRMRNALNCYVEECRVILARASYRAWFASRDGYTRERYQRNSSINKFTSDLFTFNRSVDSGSLGTGPWHAPGLDTCNMLRNKDRKRRKEQTEQQLERLFTIPEDNNSTESSENSFEKMLARFGVNATMFHPANASNTPSPVQDSWDTGHTWSVMSREITEAKDIAYGELGRIEYHTIPLHLLLKRTLDLVKSRPELDSTDNRTSMGELLTKLGVGIQRKLLRDDISTIPKWGYENDSWDFIVHTTVETETHFARRCVTSAIAD
ncbi:hypothetical protein BDV25DRAFT_144214 [Aspergillus avenaceus]|uniref:Uncharacterized protein n=1 Tax=Aspergillus avenaceus TaxID=36643 RepID=A0A5N6THV5_ASPAV|nr:hypothetical protein BDV25DRAFT_144214 [Aspergillus avenaceus]